MIHVYVRAIKIQGFSGQMKCLHRLVPSELDHESGGCWMLPPQNLDSWPSTASNPAWVEEKDFAYVIQVMGQHLMQCQRHIEPEFVGGLLAPALCTTRTICQLRYLSMD